MAEEGVAEGSPSMIDLVEENLFELQCLVKASEIYCSARCEIGRKQLLAFTTASADLVFHYQKDVSATPIIKRIPWFQGSHKTISALCFDPSGSWLLSATVDGSLYIIPALALVDGNCIIDHRWATNDITSFPSLSSQSSYSRPSALVWWQGVVECSHIGIIGTEHGEIVLINLESGRQVGLTHVKGNVSALHICQDNSLDIVSLLITSQIRQQWRLILEQRTNGYVYPLSTGKSFHWSYPSLHSSESVNEEVKTLPTTRSRLQGLKQLSVEKLAILKQKLAETRSRSLTGPISRRDSTSSSGTEETNSVGPSRHFSEGRVDSLTPECIPRDMFLAPQYTRQGQHLYTGYHPSTNHLTIHGTDISVVPLYIHKLPQLCQDVLLTQRMFYVTDVYQRTLSVVSCPLSETRIGGDSEFNPESVIGRFYFDKNEVISRVYRATDFKVTQPKETCGDNDNKYTLPKRVDDLKLDVPLVDSCIVVTNLAVYKVVLRRPLLSVFMELVLTRRELEKAGRLALVFGMNVQQLLENAGDILLSNKEFPQAVVLYKLSRCRLLKSVLKFASAGHTSELLSCVTRCLTPPAVTELSTTTRIHLSNLSVLAYTELTLRASSQQAKQIREEFSQFLSTNTFYDEVLAVSVAGQTGLCKVLHHLATQRGLHAQVLDILIKAVRSLNANSSQLLPHQSMYGFLMCLSEPSMIQAMLVCPNLARHHIAFVQASLPTLQIFVLQRLTALYDPTSAILRPLVVRCRSRHRTTSHSSQSSQFDSLDLTETLDEVSAPVEELIDTFLLVLLTLIHKNTPKLEFNPKLMQRIQLPGIEKDVDDMWSNADFKRRAVSAGFSHVVLIRNGNVYTWGNASQGCLGTGPTMSRYSSPQAVPLFQLMKLEVLSVSCGRCHSLAVTNNGVYAWGGSQFGQLGLGKTMQSSSPELITSLAEEIIIDAVAGQYHSVALTQDGRVFTWGWGVHGQLGHGNTDEKSSPTLVTALLGTVVRQISAGHAHTLVLTAEGDVYSFGSNVFGQLGHGNNVKTSTPMKITLLPDKITTVATGYFHNLAVSTTNRLYTWGASPQVLRLQAQAQKKSRILQQQIAPDKETQYIENQDNQNEGAKENAQMNGIKIQLDENYAPDSDNAQTRNDDPKISMPEANQTNGVKLTKSPSFRGVNVGMIEEPQNHLQPSLVDTSLVNGQIIQVSTGCHHSALLTKDGSVYTWGRNLDGQVGNGSRREVAIPTPLTYNPASVLARIPPRNNGYKIGERRRSPESDNRKASNDGNDNDNKSDGESTNGNDESRKDDMARIIKAIGVCCGCDYTVAVQPGGTALAWGSNSMAQLGRPPMKDARSVEGKLVLLKSTRRVVRLPHAAHSALDTPSQVPNIPTPVISYRSYDITPLSGLVRPLSVVERSFGAMTLHYVLERFNGLYDSAKIMDKCIELGNYQAASKISLLERNFADSISYQSRMLSTSHINSHKSTDDRKNDPEGTHTSDKHCSQIRHIKENTELFDKQVEKNLVETLDECEVKKQMKMSASRSLDSFQILEQELHTFDCQGGSEELCEDSKSEDISLDITEDALDDEAEGKNPGQNEDNVILGSVVLRNLDNDFRNVDSMENLHCYESEVGRQMSTLLRPSIGSGYRKLFEAKDKDNEVDAVLLEATNIVQFYMCEVEEECHTVMQQVLQKIVELWTRHNLPMRNLENIFLEHMSKFFYPLGLLLFCQNNMGDVIDGNKYNIDAESRSVLKSLSTKFCLQICSTLLRHIEQGKPTPEYIELLSQLAARHYGPPFTGYPGSNGNKTPEQMIEGVISTMSSGDCDSRPFIHIKDPEEVARFLAVDEDKMVFTCGHHFSLNAYQSEALPRMEAELLMSQPLPLPHTAQLLGDMLCGAGKVETLCPLCIPPALQSAVKNMADS